MASDPPKESFAALFEQTGKAAPRARGPRVGDTLEVVVVQVGKDAVFVELDGRRQGFIEAVDLRTPDGATKAAVGDRLRARVVHVDDQGVRLAPTIEAAAAAGVSVSLDGSTEPDAVKFAVGQAVTGSVERVESYGLFLQIDGTKGRAGRGLVPTSELGTPRGADLRKAFALGTKLKAMIVGLEEGKMRLSVTALKDDEERKEFEGFKGKGKSPGGGGAAETAAGSGFGTLGDLLKKRGKK
ncbi:MAG: S1 RNA-binding domain-containing protein [Polyangiaceae bacterium]|jgi:small subunit ribosomal protein S1